MSRKPGDMLAHFSNKKMARECIDRLLEIDRIEPDKLERVAHYFCGFLEGLKPQKKQVLETGSGLNHMRIRGFGNF